MSHQSTINGSWLTINQPLISMDDQHWFTTNQTSTEPQLVINAPWINHDSHDLQASPSCSRGWAPGCLELQHRHECPGTWQLLERSSLVIGGDGNQGILWIWCCRITEKNIEDIRRPNKWPLIWVIMSVMICHLFVYTSFILYIDTRKSWWI